MIINSYEGIMVKGHTLEVQNKQKELEKEGYFLTNDGYLQDDYYIEMRRNEKIREYLGQKQGEGT